MKNQHQAHIRLATLHDVEQLYHLEQQCFTTDLATPLHLKRFIQHSNGIVIVYAHDNQLTASAILLFRKGSKIARLYSLAVDPSRQGEGIASAMQTYIEDVAKKHGCNQLRLEVRTDNQRAITFYLRHGYVEFGTYQKFYEDKTDALRMIKYLNDVKLK